MYVPGDFALTDEKLIRSVLQENSFGVLVVSGNTGLEAVHLPMILGEGSPLTLFGHVAKANPISKYFDGTREALAIFQGPHAYISPRNYVSRPNVPTWNYVVVHVTGRPRIVSDPHEVVTRLADLVQEFDPDLAETHPDGLEDRYVRNRIGGIVAFEMKADRVEGKAKLSQNRTVEDRQKAKASLAASEDPLARSLAEWIPDL